MTDLLANERWHCGGACINRPEFTHRKFPAPTELGKLRSSGQWVSSGIDSLSDKEHTEFVQVNYEL